MIWSYEIALRKKRILFDEIEASNHICRSNTENAIIVLSNSLFSENGRGIIMIIWLSCFPSLTIATQFSSGRSSSSLLLSKEKDLMDHVPDSYWILSQLQTNLFWQMRKRWTAIKNQDIPKRRRTNLSFSKDYIQGDPNQKLQFQMTVTLVIGIFDPPLHNAPKSFKMWSYSKSIFAIETLPQFENTSLYQLFR